MQHNKQLIKAHSSLLTHITKETLDFSSQSYNFFIVTQMIVSTIKANQLKLNHKELVQNVQNLQEVNWNYLNLLSEISTDNDKKLNNKVFVS